MEERIEHTDPLALRRHQIAPGGLQKAVDKHDFVYGTTTQCVSPVSHWAQSKDLERGFQEFLDSESRLVPSDIVTSLWSFDECCSKTFRA
jgi:hypothetical protein